MRNKAPVETSKPLKYIKYIIFITYMSNEYVTNDYWFLFSLLFPIPVRQDKTTRGHGRRHYRHYVFSFRLKPFSVGEVRMSCGNLFRAAGPGYEKARSPHLAQSLGK